jgi:hypothetical protein
MQLVSADKAIITALSRTAAAAAAFIWFNQLKHVVCFIQTYVVCE